MRQVILQDVIALLAALGLQIAVLAIANPHFYTDFYNFKLPAFVAMAGTILIAIHAAQTSLWRSRPIYNQKSLTYTAQVYAIWWIGALAIGMGCDGLFYVFEGRDKWLQTPWMGTIMFLVFATIMTPICLIIQAISDRLTRRKSN
jgi:hypothetical protein